MTRAVQIYLAFFAVKKNRKNRQPPQVILQDKKAVSSWGPVLPGREKAQVRRKDGGANQPSCRQSESIVIYAQKRKKMVPHNEKKGRGKGKNVFREKREIRAGKVHP